MTTHVLSELLRQGRGIDAWSRILCLLAGQTVGCIAMFVLAFLVSPFGLPALGGWLVERLHGVKYAAMDFMAS